MRDVLRRSSGGEIAGAVLVVLASIALLVGAFAAGAGSVHGMLGVIVALAAGITGLGVHIAGREARLRRDGN
jgi:hypothetical protein